MPFLSSFKCRETGQTSESIVGASLIPNQLVHVNFLRHCLKKPDVPACVCVHTQICQQLLVYVPVLSVFTSLVVVSCSPERIIGLSCRIHIWMKHDRFPLRSVQIKCSKENCSFCSYIKPEYWGQAGHNLSSMSQSLPISPFLGPTQKHFSIVIVGINAPQ